jgi:hypothetical protein
MLLVCKGENSLYNCPKYAAFFLEYVVSFASRKSPKLFFFEIYFYAMCMGILPAYMSMHHVCAVLEEAKNGH